MVALSFPQVLSKYPSSEPFNYFRNSVKKLYPYKNFYSLACSLSSKNLEILVSILDSSSSPAESKAASFACAIAEFQQDTGRTKRSRIDPGLQTFVDSLVPPFLLEPTPPKRRTRTAGEPSPSYNSSWLTDTDKFPEAVSHFEEITANSKIMESSLQQSITSAISSAVSTAVACVQAKHESEMLFLWEMIEKSLLLRESSFATPPPDPDATPKSLPTGDSLPKASTERWNQADLGYFDPHLDRAHREGEILSVGKNVYYRNVVLFVERLQSLVTFRGASLVKTNIATSLRGSALEWYTSELSDFNRDALKNDPGLKSWVNILSHHFKVPMSVALGLLTDENYTLDDARTRRPLAQYVCAIMRHGIGCNIVDVAN